MSREAISTARPETVIVSSVLVYAIIGPRSSPDHPLGDAVETFVRREDAERFIEEVQGDDPEDAADRCRGRTTPSSLWAGGRN